MYLGELIRDKEKILQNPEIVQLCQLVVEKQEKVQLRNRTESPIWLTSPDHKEHTVEMRVPTLDSEMILQLFEQIGNVSKVQ